MMGAADDDGSGSAEELTFGSAMAELQRIVGELESDSLDVDQLAARVERATELVAWCRERIDGTRYAVTEILGRLEPGDGEGADDGRAGADGGGADDDPGDA